MAEWARGWMAGWLGGSVAEWLGSRISDGTSGARKALFQPVCCDAFEELGPSQSPTQVTTG